MQTIRVAALLAALPCLAVVWGCGAQPDAEQPTAAATAAAGGAAPAQAAAGGPGQWFVDTGCVQCHSVSAFDVKSQAQIGPDLSIAVEDVRTRFGVELEEFLENPSGTMALVFSSQIQLTPEQKQVALQKLRDAYAEHQRKAGVSAPAGGD
jgi:hypothetical protein